MESKQAHFSLKSLLIVVTGIGVAFALLPHLPETFAILLVAIAILVGMSALMAQLFGVGSIATRIVAKGMIGAIAGAIPGLAFYATMEGNGLGGLVLCPA